MADRALPKDDPAAQREYADRLLEQLQQTTSEDAGGNVSGTGAGDACEDLDIVFEREDDEDTRH